jgi:hypothetical protein
MKRFILPLLILLFVGSLFAVESAPSEVVGYFKLSSPSNTWTPLSLPFDYVDMAVTEVIGDQFSDMDEIYDILTATSTTYYDGFGWFGDLENMEYGKVYWMRKVDTNPTADYFVLGKVDPNTVTVTVNGNSWTPFALNEAADVPLESLFDTVAADGDEIYDISTALSTTYYEGFGWFGDLEFITPTHGYWYNRTAGTGFSWTYNPTRSNSIAPSFQLRSSK